MINENINICGLKISPELKAYEAENSNELVETERKNGTRTFSAKHQTDFIGGKFDAKFVFNENNKIANVLLSPAKGQTAEDGKAETQDTKWQYCKHLMQDAWGKPSFQDPITVFYSNLFTEAFSAKVLDGSEFAGGRIVIHPKKTQAPTTA